MVRARPRVSFLATLTLLSLLCPPLLAQTWEIEVLDNGKRFSYMTDRSLRLDAQSRPHIAYGLDGLYYAWHDGAEWQYEVADSSTAVGRNASLALDSFGSPHISYLEYYDYTHGDLRYAYKDAAGWHVEVVDVQSDLPYATATSLALDEAGFPQISYCDYTYHDLKYAHKDESGWHLETVDTGGSVGTYSSLTLDASGHPHISFYDGTNSALKYAYEDGAGWHFEIVDSEGPVGWYTSIALDGSGYPHISYANWVTVGGLCGTHYYFADDLKYAYKDGAGWHTETVDTEGYTGYYTSLALDASGYPHISYHDYHDGDLKYTRRDGSGWHIQTVDAEGGSYTSLALDASAHPHISYYDDTNDDLKYAYHDAAGWHFESVDRRRNLSAVSLALDGSGDPRVSYYGGGALRYLVRGDEITQGQAVDAEGGGTSLALDGSGYAHIGYNHYEDDDSNLKYAYEDQAGWHVAVVDTQGSVGQYASLGLDGEGRPHISYHDDSGRALKYASEDEMGWHLQTVDSQGFVGLDASLALDASGYPHISYGDLTHRNLKYACEDAAGWHLESVAEWGSGQTSLALDCSAYPHVSWGANGLQYAYEDGAGWHFEVVDSDESTGPYISLALDASHRAHISYQDDTNGDLKYAYRDADGWHVQVADSEGHALASLSLALDVSDVPHIIYCDPICNELRHARMIGSPAISSPALPLRITAVAVWPNPARGEIHARLAGTEGPGMARLTVVDLLGRRVMNLQQPEAMSPDATITLRLPESIPTGQYFLGVEGDGSRQFVPITVVK